MEYNKFSGWLIDCDYVIGENEEAVIRVFVSDEKEIRVFEDKEFKPYFYIIASDVQKAIKDIENADFGEGVKALRAEEVKKANAENVIKVFFRNPQDLVKARDVIKELDSVLEKREFDIPFADRYLIDKNLKPMQGIEVESGKKLIVKSIEIEHELRIAAFDLETYSPGRFSVPEKDPVLMAVLATKEKEVIYTYKNCEKNGVRCFKDEKEMLENFIKDINEMHPDVLVTYNGDSFDLPYLKNRCKKLGVECKIGFAGIKIVRRGMYNAAGFSGVQHLDAFQLLRFMARIGAVSLMKFDLENVSEKLFGKKKEKLTAPMINEIWDSGSLERLVEYNREDGEATVRLAEEFLPLQLQLARMLKMTLYDASRASSSQMVERLLLINSTENNELAPNKPTEREVNQRNLQTYQGGFVKEPLSGLHENIAVLDFRSLHPTIMISHNVSPETLKCRHEECERGKNVSPDRDWFCEKKKGFLAGILEEILNERIEIKEKMKAIGKDSHKYKILNARQHALKILLNSHYGYLGYPRARWYSRECARAVTAWSRYYIKMTVDEAEKIGYKGLYGDTDSAFLILPKGRGEKEAKEFAALINEKLPGIMELEFEGLFKRGIFVTKKEGGAAKKKYALIDFDGNLKIVGFEYVRRDWAPIAKETQKEVLQAVLEEGKPEKAIKIVRKVIEELKEGKVKKEKLVVMTQLKRKPEKYDSVGPHVAAAKKAIEKGKEIEVGGMLSFIITKAGKSISEKAELEEFVQEGNYDADYYIENQVLPAVIKITRELGYDKEDLINGGKQSSLFSFS